MIETQVTIRNFPWHFLRYITMKEFIGWSAIIWLIMTMIDSTLVQLGYTQWIAPHIPVPFLIIITNLIIVGYGIIEAIERIQYREIEQKPCSCKAKRKAPARRKSPEAK